VAVEFHAEPDPSSEVCATVAALSPENPFHTPAYIEARRLTGFRPWILSLRQHGEWVAACPAFSRSGHLNRSLEIPSWPSLPDGDTFVERLVEFCHRARISCLEINSFASRRVTMPTRLPGETGRRIRFEYLLDVRPLDWWRQLSTNHLRSIKRARKAGLQIQRVADSQGSGKHACLVESSMERRRHRGESVSDHALTQSLLAFTQSGAGELFQAVLRDNVVSSALILLADRGAYLHSAGTSSEGMACGASHYLVHEIANIMRARSMEVLNLGGADRASPGLERFKASFGATTVSLEAAELYLGSNVRRKLGAAVRLLRGDSLGIPGSLLGRLERYVVKRLSSRWPTRPAARVQ